MSIATDLSFERATTKRSAFMNGTDIDAWNRTAKTDAVTQLDGLYRLARINLIGWPLETTAERMAALDLIAHNAALAITTNTDSTITTKFGQNSSAEDRARIDAFHDVRDHTRDVLRDVARTIGPANLAGRIAWLSQQRGA